MSPSDWQLWAVGASPAGGLGSSYPGCSSLPSLAPCGLVEMSTRSSARVVQRGFLCRVAKRSSTKHSPLAKERCGKIEIWAVRAMACAGAPAPPGLNPRSARVFGSTFKGEWPRFRRVQFLHTFRGFFGTFNRRFAFFPRLVRGIFRRRNETCTGL